MPRAVRGERRHLRQPRRRQGRPLLCAWPARPPTATASSPTRCRAVPRPPWCRATSTAPRAGHADPVADTMKALVALGHAGRERSAARIASVTGSVGKTSTKDALRAMLAAQAPTSASAASFNNHVGVPISLARLPRRGALRRVRDRHEPSRRDRAAGPPGRGPCRRDHQRRGRHILVTWARKRRSPTRRPACSPACAPVQWPCSIATTAITSGWPATPAASG